MRLIDADKLNWWYKGRPIRRVIDEAPTVDAVPVVRCKECVSGHKTPYGILIRCSVFGCSGLTEDDFCSQGERRSNA